MIRSIFHVKAVSSRLMKNACQAVYCHELYLLSLIYGGGDDLTVKRKHPHF
jgi:hypothetical protein